MAAKRTEWNDSRGNGNVGIGTGGSVFRANCPAELTAANADVFGRQMSAAIHDCRSIELNLAGTKFLDCAGLGALIALEKLARRRHGMLRVVNPLPSIRQLFEIMDAGRMFEIDVNRPESPEGPISPAWTRPSDAPRPAVLWMEPDAPTD